MALTASTSPVVLKRSLNYTDSVKKLTIDPVCKMKVKPGGSKTAVYHKVTYNFCSESCKQKFLAAPDKYIQQ